MDARATPWGTGVWSFCSPRLGAGELVDRSSRVLVATVGVALPWRVEFPPEVGVTLLSGADAPREAVELRADPPRRIAAPRRVILPPVVRLASTTVLLGGSSAVADCIRLCPAF